MKAVEVRTFIEQRLGSQGEIRTTEITQATGVSRAYAHRILQEFESEGKLRRVGKANRARYVSTAGEALSESTERETSFRRFLRNEGLEEHLVFREIREKTGILRALPENVVRIVEYAFNEMLNNAIEHSRSERVTVVMNRWADGVGFRVRDRGIGIFRNIMETRGLNSVLEAIQDLLKGKQTTDPLRHSGEGIFFTSRVADRLEIRGSNRRLVFDNTVGDVFLPAGKELVGTQVDFWVSEESRRDLRSVFSQYAGDSLAFEKTSVTIRLYQTGARSVSRSEARRVLAGLENFTHIEMDFSDMEMVGQGFADEVFRVWLVARPDATIQVANASDPVREMISHVIGGSPHPRVLFGEAS
ncbi:MAG: ATP-binding protein [Bacteroidetes bacterium]|nr:ATP-binding protein [Bacteroidota bacterium]